MKQKKTELKALQKIWYQKLKDSGFEDIERGGSIVFETVTSSSNKIRTVYVKKEDREIEEEYYRRLYEAAHSETARYKNKADKIILTNFSNGVSITEIVEILCQRGCPRHRHTIRFVIRRYEMLWGIRFYNKDQLGNKPHGSESRTRVSIRHK